MAINTQNPGLPKSMPRPLFLAIFCIISSVIYNKQPNNFNFEPYLGVSQVVWKNHGFGENPKERNQARSTTPEKLQLKSFHYLKQWRSHEKRRGLRLQRGAAVACFQIRVFEPCASADQRGTPGDEQGRAGRWKLPKQRQKMGKSGNWLLPNFKNLCLEISEVDDFHLRTRYFKFLSSFWIHKSHKPLGNFMCCGLKLKTQVKRLCALWIKSFPHSNSRRYYFSVSLTYTLYMDLGWCLKFVMCFTLVICYFRELCAEQPLTIEPFEQFEPEPLPTMVDETLKGSVLKKPFEATIDRSECMLTMVDETIKDIGTKKPFEVSLSGFKIDEGKTETKLDMVIKNGKMSFKSVFCSDENSLFEQTENLTLNKEPEHPPTMVEETLKSSAIKNLFGPSGTMTVVNPWLLRNHFGIWSF